MIISGSSFGQKGRYTLTSDGCGGYKAVTVGGRYVGCLGGVVRFVNAPQVQ